MYECNVAAYSAVSTVQYLQGSAYSAVSTVQYLQGRAYSAVPSDRQNL